MVKTMLDEWNCKEKMLVLATCCRCCCWSKYFLIENADCAACLIAALMIVQNQRTMESSRIIFVLPYCLFGFDFAITCLSLGRPVIRRILSSTNRSNKASFWKSVWGRWRLQWTMFQLHFVLCLNFFMNCIYNSLPTNIPLWMSR